MFCTDIVICDRYLFDTFIDYKINFPNINFQSSIFWIILIKLLPQPDVSIMLNISFEESRKRLSQKNEPYPETEGKAKNRYLIYSAYYENYDYKIIDAAQNTNKVAIDIKNQMLNIM